MSSGVDRPHAVESAGTNQSVDRALTILRILAKHPDATVGAVAHELEVHKSTASRLLAALEHHGLVTQWAWRGTYSLGFGLVRLAGAVTAQSSFPRAAQQACEELSRSLPETINVAILDDLVWRVVNSIWFGWLGEFTHGQLRKISGTSRRGSTGTGSDGAGKDVTAAMGVRARTVLLAADGEPNIRIMELTGYSEPTVRRWRNRYTGAGIEGLADAQRPGKPVVIDELAVIVDTLANDGVPPAELGISHCQQARSAARDGG